MGRLVSMLGAVLVWVGLLVALRLPAGRRLGFLVSLIGLVFLVTVVALYRVSLVPAVGVSVLFGIGLSMFGLYRYRSAINVGQGRYGGGA